MYPSYVPEPHSCAPETTKSAAPGAVLVSANMANFWPTKFQKKIIYEIKSIFAVEFISGLKTVLSLIEFDILRQ